MMLGAPNYQTPSYPYPIIRSTAKTEAIDYEHRLSSGSPGLKEKERLKCYKLLVARATQVGPQEHIPNLRFLAKPAGRFPSVRRYTFKAEPKWQNQKRRD